MSYWMSLELRELTMRTISSKAVWTTAFINDLPDSSFLFVEGGGKKDGSGKTVPRSKRHFPYKDSSGKVDLPHLRNAIARIPQSNAPGLNKEALQMRARKLLSTSNKGGSYEEKDWRSQMSGSMGKHPVSPTGLSKIPLGTRKRKRSGEGTWARRKRHIAQAAKKNPPTPPTPPPPKVMRRKSYSDDCEKASLMVFKQSNGSYRWVIFSSNPYLDRDDEYVTQKAHESDIAELDKSGNYGPLRWWHVGEPYFEDANDWTTVQPGPGVDIGVCDFAAMHNRIRVESGTFKSRKIGKAIADHADELEASLAFAHPREEPDSGGGFLNIKSFERSLTPTDEATNIFTTLLVSKKGNDMDTAKMKALKALGVDIDEVLDGADQMQQKADKKAPYRLKSRNGNGRTPIDDVVEEGFDPEEDDDIATKLDALTAQMKALQDSMKDEPAYEPEEKLEDLMVSELTVGELQDIISSSITQKSSEPMGVVLKAVLEELEEVKSILTSKSVQSVVEEVARMKAKLERTQARLKATASRVRELDDVQPSLMRQRGIRPSSADDTLLDFEDDGDISSKASDSNPFSWIDTFIQKP